MRHAVVAAMIVNLVAGATAPPAYAQLAARTWVSATGNDLSDCTRTAPCKTFARAYDKTAPNGEIDALDRGNFGGLEITKAITIDGLGVAGILALDRGGGFSVFAGDGDAVTLRNLQIIGSAGAFAGVYVVTAKQVIIENCKIFGFPDSGIYVTSYTGGAPSNVVVSNSTISTNGGTASYNGGIHVFSGITTVSHSLIGGNSVGLLAEGSAVINADSNVLSGNGIAVYASSYTATVRLSNNDVYGNLTGFACYPSAVLASAGNNRKGNNSGGVLTPCAPNATITQQ